MHSVVYEDVMCQNSLHLTYNIIIDDNEDGKVGHFL